LDLSFKYLLATLKANDDKMTNTEINSNLCITLLKLDGFTLSLNGAVKAIKIPKMPKQTDAQMKTRVAIFCICSV